MDLSSKAEQIRLLYPDRIPVVVNTDNSSLTLSQHQFIVPKTMTYMELQVQIRKHLKTGRSSDSVFFSMKNGVMPLSSTTLQQLAEKYGSKDGFVYIYCRNESVFG